MEPRSSIRNERKGMLYRYTQVLANPENPPMSKLKKGYFTSDMSTEANRLQNHKKALMLFHFAFEIFLRWPQEYTYNYINKELLEKMQLYDIYDKYIIYPLELDKSRDYWFLAHYLYDKNLSKYDQEKYIIRAYYDILSGDKYRSKKGFFSGEPEGQKRACICLREMIRKYESFSSIKDMYAYFASPNGKHDLDRYGFKNVWNTVFSSPVEFLHRALSEYEKNDFLFHYYEFQYWYSMESKKYLEAEKKKLAHETASTG